MQPDLTAWTHRAVIAVPLALVPVAAQILVEGSGRCPAEVLAAWGLELTQQAVD